MRGFLGNVEVCTSSVPYQRKDGPHPSKPISGTALGVGPCGNLELAKGEMAHILEMYALDEGLKGVRKMGGVKHQSNKRQRKE